MEKITICFNCNGEASGEAWEPGGSTFRVECAVCGKFAITDAAQKMKNTIPEEDRWLLSAWIRQENIKCNDVVIHSKYKSEIFDKIKKPTIPEKLDIALQILADSADYAGAKTVVDVTVDYPDYWAANSNECEWILKGLDDSGLLKILTDGVTLLTLVLTIQGWERIRELEVDTTDSNQVFVAMWFNDALNEIYKKGIKAAIESKEVNCIPLRIDKKKHNNKIDDEIIMEIRRSRFMIADLTGNRGGVYFEAGFAKALGKEVIWTCRKGRLHRVHFDIRQYNIFEWCDPEELKEYLIHNIKANNLLPPIQERDDRQL